MNLKKIKDYANYSLDLDNNMVYSHYSNKYLKPFLHKDGYIRIRLCKNGKEKKFLLHRLVYEAYNGEIPENLCIDHINNDRQNNNIKNLRLATYSENSHNQKIKKNQIGYKNITLTKNNTYCVRIRNNYKFVYRKNFKTLEEAIINRDIQLKLIHKDFANYG